MAWGTTGDYFKWRDKDASTPTGGVMAKCLDRVLKFLFTSDESTAAPITCSTVNSVTPEDHSARHEDGGADEISITGLAGTPADLTTHAAAADPHTGYRLESADHSHATTGLQAGQIDHGTAMVAASLLDDDHTQYRLESADHSHQSTGLEGGQLDHGLAMSAASLLDDDHTQYRLESADHSHQSTGAQAGQVDHGLSMIAASLLDDDHTQYRLESADHSHQTTGAQAGQLDHGLALTGLSDDDHPLYRLKTTEHGQFTRNNHDLARQLNLTYENPNKAVTSLGINVPHSFFWVEQLGKFFGARLSTLAVTPFSVDVSTTPYTVASASDANYIDMTDMIYVPSKAKLYAVARRVTTNIGVILEVDPSTFAVTERWASASACNSAGAITTDNTYLYASFKGSGAYESRVVKVALSNWAVDATLLAGTAIEHIQTLKYDGVLVWGSNTAAPSLLYEMTPGAGTLTASSHASTVDTIADDWPIVGDLIFMGNESGTKYITIYDKVAASFTRFVSPVNAACYGSYYHAGYVWFVYATSPGQIVRLDPVTLCYKILVLPTGQNLPNEMASNGNILYITTFEAPSNLLKLYPESLDGTGAIGFLTIPDFIGSAQGDILYRDATAWARLAAGTAGKYLKTGGAAANPSWDTPAAGIGLYDSDWGIFDEFAGWATTVAGSGVATVVSRRCALISGATAGSTARARVNFGRDVVSYARTDFGKAIAFEVLIAPYGLTTNGDSFVVYSAATETGDLGYRGLGFKWVNGVLEGTWYGSGLNTLDLSTTLATTARYRLKVVFTPATSIEFFVDGVSKGSSSTDLPTGQLSGGEFRASVRNNADAVNQEFDIFRWAYNFGW